MFGNRKARRLRIPISKDDIKKAIKKANDKLQAENNRIQDSVSEAKVSFKSIQSKAKQAEKELKNTTAKIDSRISECEAAESQIFSLKNDLSSLADKFKKELDIEESLRYSVDQLVKKEAKLGKAVDILEKKKEDIRSIKSTAKEAKKEYAQVKKDLSKIISDMAKAKKDIHALNISKDVIQKEYNNESERLGKLKSKISSEVRNAEIMLSEKKEYFQSETARLDQLIIDRIEELSDNTELVNHKNREYQLIAAQVLTAENRIAHAESKTKQILDNQQIQIDKVKEQFKHWKLTQLDQVAKLKLKGKIDNIDKAGLKDILDV